MITLLNTLIPTHWAREVRNSSEDVCINDISKNRFDQIEREIRIIVDKQKEKINSEFQPLFEKGRKGDMPYAEYQKVRKAHGIALNKLFEFREVQQRLLDKTALPFAKKLEERFADLKTFAEMYQKILPKPIQPTSKL